MGVGYFVGPIRPSTFYRQYMADADASLPAPPANFSQVSSAEGIDVRSAALVNTITSQHLSPGVAYFVVEPLQTDQVDPDEWQKTNTRLYPEVGAVARPVVRRSPRRKQPAVPALHKAPFDFTNASLGVEIEESEDFDAFIDPEDYLTLPRSSSETLAQYTIERRGNEATCRTLTSHAHAQLARQHRTALFQLLLCGDYARLLRWDRSGAVVTERFNYIDKPELLAEFFWRFAHLSDVQRGWDPTATLASAREARLLHAALRRFLEETKEDADGARKVRRLPGAEWSLDANGVYPTWKLRVRDEETRHTVTLVVNAPFDASPQTCGRATRAYLAYDLRARRLVFLKDAWRQEYAKMLRAEAGTYRALERAGVPHLLTLHCGGDVPGEDGKPQCSGTQNVVWVNRRWDCRKKDSVHGKMVHHRIVQDIAFPLVQALDEREFVQVVHDALLCMGCAYHNADIIHRDVSAGNIMIGPDGRGVLNDWDMAGEEYGYHNIGTWYYMSINLLRDPSKLHDALDDFESMYWSTLHGAVKLFAPARADDILPIFQHRNHKHGTSDTGGDKKKQFLMDSAGDGRMDFPEFSAPLQELIASLTEAWRRYYVMHDDPESDEQLEEEMEQMYRETSFWAEKFAVALEKLSAARTTHEQLQHQEPQHDTVESAAMLTASKKRKADIEPTPAIAVRQAKRTKTTQQDQ